MTSKARGTFLVLALFARVVFRAPDLTVYLLFVWLLAEVFVAFSRRGRWGRIANTGLATALVAFVGFQAFVLWRNLQLVAEIESLGASRADLSGRLLPGPVDSISLDENVGDDELEAILRRNGLEHLAFVTADGSAISDRGLQMLTKFDELERVYLGETNVTEHGVARFKAARPDCRVVYVPKE